MTVPGSTSGWNKCVGRPSSESSGVAHVRRVASIIWVVVAMVYSDARRPVSQ